MIQSPCVVKAGCGKHVLITSAASLNRGRCSGLRATPHLQEDMPRKDALSKFGITDRCDLSVQVVQQQKPVLGRRTWLGRPRKALTANQATELWILLRDAGEKFLDKKSPARPPEPKRQTGRHSACKASVWTAPKQRLGGRAVPKKNHVRSVPIGRHN